MPDPRELDAEQFCYLTTIGRVTGRPHEIENWCSQSAPLILEWTDRDDDEPGALAAD